MSQLIKIAGHLGEPRASVIFVHGLGGHAYDTWRRDIKKKAGDDASFWPLWLAQDVEGISVYTLAYEAPASNWLGTSMPLQDRAVNVLEILLSEPGLKTGPICFVCHSLGGLIIKQLLLDLQQQKDRRQDAKDLLNRVTEIVFAATPHTGSRHASLLDSLRFFAWPSTVARTLAANDPALRVVNVAYRGLADERRNILKHRIFYETQNTPLGVIVDEASSDPGLPGDPSVPIDATHISIVKPVARMSVFYGRTRDFVAAGAPASEKPEGELKIFELPPVRSEPPLNIVPKLIRVAAIGVVVLIGYKGTQALIAPPPPIEQIQKPLVEQLHVKDIQIAALTKMLLEKNPAAGPGARQAVETAVTSIAKGAEEGDSRLETALGLLKENKIAEASQLLTAFAGEKEARAEKATAQAEKDRKEAAVAYRNLGAIAGLANPKRALEAYEKALALDPDDIQSLYWTGYILVDYGDLNKAQARLERVQELAQSGMQEAYRYAALGTLGDIKQRRGDLDGALQSYRGTIPIISRLAKSDPGNGEWQYNLGISNERVGNVQLAQGDLGAASKSYEARHEIISRLAKSDPGNAGWQRDLSVSYQKVGDVQQAQGNLSAALASNKDSLAIAERLAKSDPGNAEWQRDLAASYNRIGDVQQAQGDLAAALKSYSDGLSVIERLAKSDPGNAGWQRDLSVSYNRVGDVQKAQGDLAGALKSYSDGFAVIEQLAKSDPGNAEWQRDLSFSYEKIGNVQWAQGDLAGALKSYCETLDLRERLAKSGPANAEWQHDLAIIFANLASVHKQSGDKAKAGDDLRQGQAIMARLTKLSPENGRWKHDLAWFDGQIEDLDRETAEVRPSPRRPKHK